MPGAWANLRRNSRVHSTQQRFREFPMSTNIVIVGPFKVPFRHATVGLAKHVGTGEAKEFWKQPDSEENF